MTTPSSPQREVGWNSGWRVAKFFPRRYAWGGTLWACVAFIPLLPGLLLKAAFDRLAPGQAASGSALSFLALLAAVQVMHGLFLIAAQVAWTRWWSTVTAWIRANLLRAVVAGAGPASLRMPGSPGEAIGRFRDDVDDIVWLADGWVDLAGAIILGVVGVAVMASIDAALTMLVVVPLVGIVFVTRWLGNRVRRIHRGLRQSGAAVTAFVADVFSNAQTLKTSGAEANAIARFHALNVSRGSAAVRAEVTKTVIYTVGIGVADISTGLILLFAAAAMRRNDFTVGDLALFTSYGSSMTFLPRRTGETIARARAAGVSTDRLARFVPDAGADGVFAPAVLDLTKKADLGGTAHDRSARVPFERLSVRGLTASPAPGRRGIIDVDFDIDAGEFVVVTGIVGAGKSMLLRALLGLTTIDAGTITWNGEVVVDPGTELVPPRVAYVAQVPKLFSAAVDENVRLGWPASDDELAAAIEQACLRDDVAAMPDGLATLVGPRGMRLSGGQAQRTAAARALVRRPDVLLVDDLSSALDPQTETRLWDALAALPTACLAVSHRPAVLARADRVINLEDGRVVSLDA
ncbi:MAG: ATP-binding cassette, subfamily bacterial [Actinomycetota bacterium]